MTTDADDKVTCCVLACLIAFCAFGGGLAAGFLLAAIFFA